MPNNSAAWMTKLGGRFEVNSAPYTAPKDNEIVVKNGAIAINPIDWIMQDNPSFFGWVKAPSILGTDIAGEVVQVGRLVTRFKVGDRVVAHAMGIDKEVANITGSAFQEYTIIMPHMAAHIPPSVSYEQASVLPLALSTAACGLFEKDQLALNLPTVPKAKPTGQTVLIWGGSTSVGCNAIQLAVAAGYEVYTTCSPKNFDLVTRLGASRAFDYNSTSVTQDLIAALKGKTMAGALTMGFRSAEAVFDVLPTLQGRKFIAQGTYPTPEPRPTTLVLPRTAFYFITASIGLWWKSKTRGVGKSLVFGSTLAHNKLGQAIYQDFLPAALAEGSFVPMPAPLVVGKGLNHVQEAMDVQKKGVSAKKVVVSL